MTLLCILGLIILVQVLTMIFQVRPAHADYISGTDADALIPVEVRNEISQGVAVGSAALQLGTRLPDMRSDQQRMPVLSLLPMAYFVSGTPGAASGETAMKRTTRMAWANKYLNVEEIAVIVPVEEKTIADASYDLWGQVKPRIIEAFGIVIDGAVLFSTNKPASWPAGIVPSAIAAGNAVTLGAGADIYDDIMGEGGVLSLVEADGFPVTGHVADMTMKAKLRGLRDANGQPIFVRSMQDQTRYELDGEPMVFPENGAFDASTALMISGSWKEMVYSIRQDMTFKILTEGVIQDPTTGAIVYNLAQQDMVALRCVMRLAWQLPNPINRMSATEGGKVGAGGADQVGRYPFAVLQPAA